MKTLISYCKGFIKSIFGGFVFLFVKLFSIVNKKQEISNEYIRLKPDDGDIPPPPPPPPYKKEKN